MLIIYLICLIYSKHHFNLQSMSYYSTNELFYVFLNKVIEIFCVFYTHSTSRFTLTKFQMLIIHVWLVAPISESSDLRAPTAAGCTCYPLIHILLVSIRWIGQHKYIPLSSSVLWGCREDETRKFLPLVTLRRLARWGWKTLQIKKKKNVPYFFHPHRGISWDIQGKFPVFPKVTTSTCLASYRENRITASPWVFT